MQIEPVHKAICLERMLFYGTWSGISKEVLLYCQWTDFEHFELYWTTEANISDIHYLSLMGQLYRYNTGFKCGYYDFFVKQ